MCPIASSTSSYGWRALSYPPSRRSSGKAAIRTDWDLDWLRARDMPTKKRRITSPRVAMKAYRSTGP